jgi:hypothetical protein
VCACGSGMPGQTVDSQGLTAWPAGTLCCEQHLQLSSSPLLHGPAGLLLRCWRAAGLLWHGHRWEVWAQRLVCNLWVAKSGRSDNMQRLGRAQQRVGRQADHAAGAEACVVRLLSLRRLHAFFGRPT